MPSQWNPLQVVTRTLPCSLWSLTRSGSGQKSYSANRLHFARRQGENGPFFLGGGGGGGGQRIIFKGQSRNLWGMRLSQSEATRRGRGQEGSAVGGLGRAVWSALKSLPWTSVTHGGALRMQKFRPPAVENSELTNVLFKAWSRSDYSDLRFHHCREFLLCLNF